MFLDTGVRAGKVVEWGIHPTIKPWIEQVVEAEQTRQDCISHWKWHTGCCYYECARRMVCVCVWGGGECSSRGNFKPSLPLYCPTLGWSPVSANFVLLCGRSSTAQHSLPSLNSWMAEEPRKKQYYFYCFVFLFFSGRRWCSWWTAVVRLDSCWWKGDGRWKTRNEYKLSGLQYTQTEVRHNYF